MRAVITGNLAAALGAKLCRPQVISAYPITPQTTIIEYLAKMVADKDLNAEYIKVESEHSAMASLVGAAATGCRVFTATSSHGLMLMHEMLWQAMGLRLPIVMVNVNRAVGAPWTIYTEQTDSLAQRDSGWLQFYCENSQELLDTIIQAYYIAEMISLPVMVVSEGFVLSHTAESVDIPDQKKVDLYLPQYFPKWKLDISNPCAFGGHANSELFAQLRKNVQLGMDRAFEAQYEAATKFSRFFKRDYPAIEVENKKDSEVLIITSGTISGTVRQVVHEKYPNISLMKIRMFRPFPYESVRLSAEKFHKIIIIDRNISFGSRGIFAESVRSAMFDSLYCPLIFEFIAGIGGVDVTEKTITDIIELSLHRSRPLPAPVWQEDLNE